MDQPTPPDHLAGTTPLPRSRAWRGIAVGLLLTASVGVIAWRMLSNPPAPAPTGRARQAGTAQPVGIAIARAGDIRIIQDGLGTVTPLASVTIRTQIAGQLQSLGFTEGQMVKKGDFLAQIDPRPYQALLDQYSGQLAKDQGALDQARLDLARYQKLLRQDSIARQQAEDQLYQVAQDEGAVRSDQALIAAQKLNLTYCHITAPVSGRVGLRQVDVGNYVQTSDANGLVVLTQLQPISVIFTIPEDVLPQLQARLAQQAKLSVAAYDRANDTKLADGMLSNLDNVIDTSTGTLKLRASFANADEKLFPNQFVNARLLIDTHTGVVTLPAAAVQHGTNGAFVYTVQDGIAHVSQVETGATDGDLLEITKGLAAGARVVVDGIDRLKDGAAIAVQSVNGDPVGAGGHNGGGGGGAPGDTGGQAGRHHRHRPDAGQGAGQGAGHGDAPAAGGPAPQAPAGPTP